MMTPEERKRFKEEEKAHLRKLRALRAAARRQRPGTAAASVARMVADFHQAVDVHNEFMDRLDQETARNEARVEVTLEAKAPSTPHMTAARHADTRVLRKRAEPESERGTEAVKTIGRMPDIRMPDITDQ